MTKIHKAYYQSEIGLLEIVGTDDSIKSISFVEPGDEALDQAEMPPMIAACVTQLDEYFRGERKEFTLSLDPDGTEFQKTIWQHLLTVPYGQTVSYLDVAKSIGNEKAVRAVGAANGQNRIVIVMPCHRVIGSNGNLTGYGGGLWRKEWLLKHEGGLGSSQLALF